MVDAREELTQQLSSRLIPNSGPDLDVVLHRALDIFSKQKTEAQEQVTRKKLLGHAWIEPNKREFVDDEGTPSPTHLPHMHYAPSAHALCTFRTCVMHLPHMRNAPSAHA